ncbi:DUF3500 domain-containing protein [Chryseolinea soli]|nr:DUF3500 domain-containing protein [Chryseolinea soli]
MRSQKRKFNPDVVLAGVMLILPSIFIISACNDKDEQVLTPSVTSFTPTSGPAGTTVTITGLNFSSTLANNAVSFNGTGATISSASSTALVVTVPTAATTGKITVTVDGQSVETTDDFTVTTTSSTSDCGSATTQIEKLVCLANTFLGTLTSTQQSSVVITLNLTNAKRWSNLPCALSCRNGLLFSSLTTAQQTAALALIEAASGTVSNEGYEEFQTIRAADDYLGTMQSGYSAGNYVIAFLGTPSTTGKWMIQFGGHHYAQNITYDNGQVTSITPMHEAVEPNGSFTVNGTTYSSPMTSELAAVREMLAAFTTSELASAKISSTFSDCLMVPGSTTNTFPSTKQGIQVSSLSTAAQAKVLVTIAAWVNDVDPTSAATYLTTYQNELANTYVTYSSNTSGTSGTASSFFTSNTDYVRIDGPSVWIEFICQNGVVISNQVHYHTVMRDHNRDYIGL